MQRWTFSFPYLNLTSPNSGWILGGGYDAMDVLVAGTVDASIRLFAPKHVLVVFDLRRRIQYPHRAARRNQHGTGAWIGSRVLRPSVGELS